MKKTILLFAIALFYASCSSLSNDKNEGTELVISELKIRTIALSQDFVFTNIDVIDSINRNNVEGHNNWRLPNREELEKMYKLHKSKEASFSNQVYLSDEIGAQGANALDFRNGQWCNDCETMLVRLVSDEKIFN
jgi:hypothetical protein